MTFAVFSFAFLGLVVGSFLNVVVLRRGVRSLGGRSACMSCGKQLLWYDMVPVFSWLSLRGRCRFCRERISLQYPLVEAATGIGFAVLGQWVSSAQFIPSGPSLVLAALYFCVLALLVCIAAYDTLHTIIPDEWSYLFAVLAFLAMIFNFQFSIFNLFAGPIAALPLFGLWLFSRGEWMGLGDAKLALGIGWLLGPLPGLLAVFGAFIIGAAVSLPLLLISSELWKKTAPLFTPRAISQRLAGGFTIGNAGISYRRRSLGSEKEFSLPPARWTMKSEIPFGPFLILSCIIIWFASLFGIDTLRIFGLLLLSSSLS